MLFSEKKKYIYYNINMHINNEKIAFAQLEEENYMIQTINKLFMNKIIDEYNYMEENANIWHLMHFLMKNKTFFNIYFIRCLLMNEIF